VWFNSAEMWRAQALANRRRRDNTGADEIAHAIHRMVDAMQPNAAQPRARVAPTRPVTMEDFMRHMPANYLINTGRGAFMAFNGDCYNVEKY